MEKKLNRTFSERVYYIMFSCVSLIWLLQDIKNPLFDYSWIFWMTMFFIFSYALIKSVLCPLILIKSDVFVFYIRAFLVKKEIKIKNIILVNKKISNGMEFIELHLSDGKKYNIKPYVNNKNSVRLILDFIESYTSIKVAK